MRGDFGTSHVVENVGSGSPGREAASTVLILVASCTSFRAGRSRGQVCPKKGEKLTSPNLPQNWVGLMAGFYILVVVVERRMRTTPPQSRSPELIFVDFCSACQDGAVRNGPGPDFGRKPAQTDQH